MIKQGFAVAALLALSGCGGGAVVPRSDMSRVVSASPSSPWLTVEKRGDIVPVSGMDGTRKVQVAPDVSAVVEAQLRTALQPKYFTDLIIGCRGLEASVAVSGDAEPATAKLKLEATCRIVARGIVVSKVYRLEPSLPLSSVTPAMDTVVAKLLDDGSTQLAARLWTEVTATGARR